MSLSSFALVALNETGSDLNASVGNLATILWVAVGAVLVTRLPRNRVGWLVWLGGVLLAISQGAGGFATYGLTTQPGSVPGAIWLAWLSAWIGAPAFFTAAGFLPLVYPTGHLLSARWRIAVVLGVVATTLTVIGNALGPFSSGYPPGVENPLLLSGQAAGIPGLLAALAAPFGLGFAGSSVISIVLRYRRSAGMERQQLKLFAYMAAILVVGLVVAFASSSWVAWLAVLSAIALMPVAIGIAVLRYRLYDVDLVIRRTAVYVPLTAVLAGLYAATTALLQRLFIDVTGNPSDGAVILSTLILAATFTPIRTAIQGVVDRRFRDAPDLERRLRRFTDSVASAIWEPSSARVMRSFLAEIVDALDVSGGVAYSIGDDGEHVAGRTVDRGSRPSLTIAVAAGGRVVGRLELDERRRSRQYTEFDVGLLRVAADHLGEALADQAARPVGDRHAARATSRSDGE